MLYFVEWVDWMLNSPWAFWLLINIGVYIAYFILLYSAIGIWGLVLPAGVGAATVVMGDPWWVGFIGITFAVLAVLPIVFVKSDP